MVTERAEKTFDVEGMNTAIRDRDKTVLKNLVDVPEWLAWLKHWGDTCQVLIDEFTAEGLTETVKEFEAVLAWHRENHAYEYKKVLHKG
jgi:hypothetical protein